MASHEDSVIQSSLRIGETILLYTKQKSGFIFSELSSSHHNSVAVCGAESLTEPYFPNVHFATFKVLPASKYKSQSLLTAFNKSVRNHELSKEEKGLKFKLEKSLQLELAENKAEQDRLAGTAILYGGKVQLQHTLSKKRLMVNTTKTSRIEATNLQVELSEEVTEGCIFTVLPRYKVRSVGDEVRYNDQVKFESVKTKGQFLHVSVNMFGSVGFRVLEKCHELNLSAIESAFTIVPHYRPMPSHKPSDLQAGAVVRLFHREGECYVAAEGSFAENPAVVEDVHCRYRHADATKPPSSSANTYWQFENEGDCRSGEPISWGERCRIKHLPTRRYLAVVEASSSGGYDVVLKEKCQRELISGAGQELETVFSLSPIIQEGDTVQVQSYARIKHLQTRTWLHLDKQKRFVRSKKTFDPDAHGLKALQWDRAELSTLTATPTMNYDDAFTLEKVEEQQIDKFNFVAGIVPVLVTHIKTFSVASPPQLQPRGAYQVSSALRELAGFMLTASQRDTKDRQKLLRNLRVLELVIAILGLFDPNAPDKDAQRQVCQACYLVIENYLKGDSRKNENYLARSIDFFKKQIGLKLNAEKVMTEMVKDNIVIISKMDETEIDYMIKQLVETKDPLFMEFLGNLCECAGRPIPSTQNAILDKLLAHHGKDVFFRTAVGGSEQCPQGEEGKLYYVTPQARGWMLLSEIADASHCCVRQGGVCQACDQCQFLAKQLQLFGKLCKGNNPYTIARCESYHVTFSEALLCAQDQSFQPELRSEYVKLIKVMFVDVGENRDILENLSLSFVYSDIKEDPYEATGAADTVALTGVENKYFPRLRQWILYYLRSTAEHGVVASEVKVNVLTADVLDVLQLLVKYGYYDDKQDVDDVLEPLITVLDGMSDSLYFTEKSSESCPLQGPPGLPCEQEKMFKTKGGRYKETAETLPMFAIKKGAMEVVNLFISFRFYIRLQRFMYDFRVLRGDVVEEGRGTSVGATNVLTHVLTNSRLQQAIPRALLLATEAHPPQDLYALQDSSSEDDIASNPHLVGLARQRLKHLFSFSAYAFEDPTSSQAPITDILLDLSMYQSAELVQGSLHLLNRLFSSEITLFEKAIQSQLLVTETSQNVFHEIGKLLPILRRLLGIDASSNQRSDIISILRKFSGMCSIDGDEEEPHPQNQRILYNSGVLSDVLNYILNQARDRAVMSTSSCEADEAKLKPSNAATTSKPCSQSAVFKHCYLFLKALAKSNLEVQRRLFDRTCDLLEANVALASMGELLTEVFTGGPEICLMVREEHVEKIFNVINSETEGRAELISALQAIAKVEELDLPVNWNQAFIIKYFSKHREELCDHLLGRQAGKQAKRYGILTKSIDGDPDLHLLLNMTDLLASCAEGENVFIESVFQTVYSVSEVLEILADPDLLPERKRPFARFLVSVYLNTTGDLQQSRTAELFGNSKMWEYLEQTGVLLHTMGRLLRAVPESESRQVRQGLSSGYSARAKTYRIKSPTPRAKSAAVPSATQKDRKHLSGMLVYFSNGVLPLLKAFYRSFLNHLSEQKDPRITLDILSALLGLCDVLSPHLVHDVQVKLYRGTVLTMLSCCQGQELGLDQQMLDVFEVKTKMCKSQMTSAREHYNRMYYYEQELNQSLNMFVRNYRKAYEGPNTVQAQIGAKYNVVYSEQGDESLPLGPSFQEHVKCFMNEQAHLVKPVAERLLTQLEVSFSRVDQVENEKERCQQDELDVKCLQLLRALIHNELMQINPNLKEASASKYRKRCETRLHPLQNAIQDFGNAASRILPLLSHPSDPVRCEVLAFLKALLYSGNRHVQEGMRHLLATREERLFIAMQSLLVNAALAHNERYALLQQVGNQLRTDRILSASPASVVSFKKSTTSTDNRPGSMAWTKDSSFRNDSVVLEISMEDADEASPRQVEMTSFIAFDAATSLLLAEQEEAGEMEEDKSNRRRSTANIEIQKFEGTLTRRNNLSGEKREETLAKINPRTAEILRFQDPHHVRLALQVLGLMCDGQYRLMQNYLREQPDNAHTINLVGDVALSIHNFHLDINTDTMQLVHLILQTLIEMCVGNFPNQEVIYNRQILAVLNHIFQLDYAVHKNSRNGAIEISVNLKASAVELLEVMLEKTDERTPELVQEIVAGLDIPALHDTLGDFYELMNNAAVKDRMFDDEAERGLFRTYHVLIHLADYGVDLAKLEPKKSAVYAVDSAYKAWGFCKRQSRSVEVVYTNMEDKQILTRVNFHFKPEYELREEVIETVKWRVNRDSHEDRLRDFLDWMEAVKKDTIHTISLQDHWYTKYIIKFPLARYRFLLGLTLLLNLFVLISFSVPADQIDSIASGSLASATFLSTSGAFAPDVMRWFGEYVLFVFGSVHLFMSVWMVAEYFVLNWPNFVRPRIFYAPFKFWKKVSRKKPWLNYCFTAQFKRWSEPPEETYSDIGIFNLKTIYFIVFLLSSILSLAFDGYFYAICTLYIIVHNDILKRVLKSITRNGVSLLWVAILGLIVLYIYAVMSFAFLHESFLAPDNDDATLFCENLGQCFISVVRYGLLDNLGLVVPYLPEGDFQAYGLRILFDVSFFIIVTTIGLNIVFGIIIDTFAELRDERHRTEEDQKSICFICSLPSHEFERRANGFDDHVKHDHNMWSYIYYAIYLNKIDVSDHNAIESFVYNMMRRHELDFFPLLAATCLETVDDDVTKQLEELKGMVKNVLKRFEKEEYEKTCHIKRQEQKKWEDKHLYKLTSFDDPASLDYRQRRYDTLRASFSGSQHGDSSSATTRDQLEP